MAELKNQPVPHSHKEFMAKGNMRKAFDAAYKALELVVHFIKTVTNKTDEFFRLARLEEAA